MSKPTLLLQFRTDKSEEHEQKCIKQKGGFSNNQLKIVNVLRNGRKLPKPKDLDKYHAVITGASGQFNVTDWSKETKKKVQQFLPLLREIIKRDHPMLAICFGHQMIANLLGGKVASDDKQREAGTYQVSLTKKGQQSILFKGVPKSFYAVAGHKDSVTKLPKQAKLLASSKRCKIHAYQIKDNIFSVQFHPELDLEGLVWRLRLYPEYSKGKSVKDIHKQYHKIPYAAKVLKNFRKIVEEKLNK